MQYDSTLIDEFLANHPPAPKTKFVPIDVTQIPMTKLDTVLDTVLPMRMTIGERERTEREVMRLIDRLSQNR